MKTLEVVWKDLKTRQRFVIGVLTKGRNYVFEYKISNVSQACEKGFNGIVAFPSFSKVYTSENIFPVFGTRLPDAKRKDISEILHKYGLEHYDDFELLKRTGGRLPIDTLEFIDPIILDNLENDIDVTREFFIAGVRHYELCDGKYLCDGKENSKCTIKLPLKKGDLLGLKQESDNQYDKYAVAVYKSNEKIGYIPVYYSQAISNAISEGRNINLIVKNFDPDASCQECLKAVLSIKMNKNVG